MEPENWKNKLLLQLVLLVIVQLLIISAQVYVGSPCSKHADCIRYCAYSKYGVEGASCCFPEKIRISRFEWIDTGSSTCYCCPLPDKYLYGNVTGISNFNNNWNADGLPVVGRKVSQICKAYLEQKHFESTATSLKVSSSKVTDEFCDKRCVQVMVNVKMSFEFPSVCRSEKFTE